MTPERCSMSCLNPFVRTHLTLPHTRITEIEADVRVRNEDKTQVKKKAYCYSIKTTMEKY